MAYRSENSARQTQHRHQLLDNGYTPLPNIDKRCMLKGWSKVAPTHDSIDEDWGGRLAYQATGLRVENGLCAIDVDIDDEDLVQDIWNSVLDELPHVGECLIRYGKGFKELWMVRAEKVFSVAYSKGYLHPDDDPETADTHRVEIFGGGHPRQMGSFGAHTMGDDGDPVVEYAWDAGSPLDVPLADLVELSMADITTIIEIVNEIMEASGWAQAEGFAGGMTGDVETRYDLTEEMLFDCEDGAERDLAELSGWAAAGGTCRCSASWLDGQRHRNKTRCLVSNDHEGFVSILDMASWARHLPEDAAQRDEPLREKVEAFADAMMDNGYAMPEEHADAPQSFQDRVHYLLNNWAYCAERPRNCLPMYGEEERSCNLQGLRGLEARHSYTKEGPRGGVKSYNPADVWYGHSARKDAIGYRYLPAAGEGLQELNGEAVINSYRAPERAEALSGSLSTWQGFMEHLLPATGERDWFMDWLAFQAQNPEVPSVGVLMVATTHGVGRGSLFEILQHMFGVSNCRSVTSSALLGDNSQAQYTDWMVNNHMITVDEILPDGDGGAAMEWKRQKAYERLKERVDPKARLVSVVRKGLPNYNDISYSSYLLATNHENAIPILSGDRRFVILTNTSLALAANDTVYSALNKMRDPVMNQGFIAAIYQDLLDRDVSAFDPYDAPRFDGRQRMLDANKTELDDMVEAVLENMPHDWCTREVLLNRLDLVLEKKGLKNHFRNYRAHAMDSASLQWSAIGRQNINEDRTRVIVLVRNARVEAEFLAMSLAERGAQYDDVFDIGKGPSMEKLARLRGVHVAK